MSELCAHFHDADIILRVGGLVYGDSSPGLERCNEKRDNVQLTA